MSGKKNEDGGLAVVIILALVVFCLIAAAFKPTVNTYGVSKHGELHEMMLREGFSHSEANKSEIIIEKYLKRLEEKNANGP